MEDSRVDNILVAARKRFAHYGVSKTTMNEIAADIGMSKASLYYYFPDKEKLFVAVVEEEISEFVSAMESLIAKRSKASFKLKKYVSYRNEFFNKWLNLAKLENANISEVFNPLYNDLRIRLHNQEKSLIEKLLLLGIEEKEFLRIPVETYADLFVSAMVGLRSSAVYPTFSLQSDAFQKITSQTLLFVEIFLKSIRQ